MKFLSRRRTVWDIRRRNNDEGGTLAETYDCHWTREENLQPILRPPRSWLLNCAAWQKALRAHNRKVGNRSSFVMKSRKFRPRERRDGLVNGQRPAAPALKRGGVLKWVSKRWDEQHLLKIDQSFGRWKSWVLLGRRAYAYNFLGR